MDQIVYFKEKNLRLNSLVYPYRLESINLKTKKVTLCFKERIDLENLLLQTLVCNETIIHMTRPSDSAHIGYYYGLIEDKNDHIDAVYSLKKGDFNIKAIDRQGNLTIDTGDGQRPFSKKPIDLYKDRLLLEKFTSTQALYIGYLAGIAQKTS